MAIISPVAALVIFAGVAVCALKPSARMVSASPGDAWHEGVCTLYCNGNGVGAVVWMLMANDPNREIANGVAGFDCVAWFIVVTAFDATAVGAGFCGTLSAVRGPVHWFTYAEIVSASIFWPRSFGWNADCRYRSDGTNDLL